MGAMNSRASYASGSRSGLRLRHALILGWAVVGTVCLAAGYEALIALSVLDVGPHPGEAPPGESHVVGAAILVLFAAAVVVFATAWVPARIKGLATVLVALNLAAAAFLVARFVSYDPYYAPTLRRMSDGGAVPPRWVGAVTLLAVVAAWAVPRHRVGLVLTSAALMLCGFTALASGLGH